MKRWVVVRCRVTRDGIESMPCYRRWTMIGARMDAAYLTGFTPHKDEWYEARRHRG